MISPVEIAKVCRADLTIMLSDGAYTRAGYDPRELESATGPKLLD